MRYPCGHGRDDIPVECVVCQLEALRAERDEAVALLGEVRSGVIFRDTPKNDDLANRIDAIVARRKA